MMIFKAGDKFVPHKPKNGKDVGWCKEMNKYEGKVLNVDSIQDGFIEHEGWQFEPYWCEKVLFDRFPDNKKTIDWKQREWEASVAAMQATVTAVYSNKETAAAMSKTAERANIDPIEFIAKISIENAKELVKQFKGEHYDKRDSESNT